MPLDPATWHDADLMNLGEFVADARVLEAMRATPREVFAGARADDRAVDRLRLARTCELLGLVGTESVLLVEPRSAWEPAVLSQLACLVVTVVSDTSLCQQVGRRLDELGVRGAIVVCGELERGFAGCAPYDAIALVGDGSARLASMLDDQLAAGASLVAAMPGAPGHLTVRHRLDPALQPAEMVVPLVEPALML